MKFFAFVCDGAILFRRKICAHSSEEFQQHQRIAVLKPWPLWA
jgi:hypothetical protein